MDAQTTAPQRFEVRSSAPPTFAEIEAFLGDEDVWLIRCRDESQLLVRGDAEARELPVNWRASILASHREELVTGPALHLVGAGRWTWAVRLLEDDVRGG